MLPKLLTRLRMHRQGPPNREETNIVVAAAPDKAEDAQTRSFQMRSSWASGRRKRSSQSGGDKGPPNRKETNIVVAEATSSDGTIVADIVGSHVLLPVNSLLPDVHEIVHPESALQKQAGSYTALKAPHVLLTSLLSDVHEPKVIRDDSIIATVEKQSADQYAS